MQGRILAPASTPPTALGLLEFLACWSKLSGWGSLLQGWSINMIFRKVLLPALLIAVSNAASAATIVDSKLPGLVMYFSSLVSGLFFLRNI